MENIETLTSKALESARRIAHDLLPPVLEKFGLQAGVDELVLEYNTTQKVSVSRTGEGSFDSLSSEKQLPVFRILQELLHNSVRHGKASEVLIHVEMLATHWRLDYRDNGCGFEVNDPKVRKGIGLRNIESRVGLLHGALTLKAQPGQGVHYQITFPNEK
ncbi:sensor histidine kinase [Flavobacterium sp.]|uniref:sensor histidine kinase n=1 Tax=Flavobacterium sp. TaxID=239 RepID=UPI0039198523